MSAAAARAAAGGMRPLWARGADLAVLSALFVLALVGFAPVYGTPAYLVAGLAALALALLLAVAGARWRLNIAVMALAVILVHVLLGTALAAPTHALWRVIPTLSSLLELVTAPATAWKTVLTMAPPVGTADGVLVVVWLSMLVLATVAFSLVLRTRWYGAAWIGPMVLLAESIVLGTSDETWPRLRGVAMALLTLGWLSWRFESARLDSARSTIITGPDGQTAWRNPVVRRRVIGGAVILALAAGVVVALGPTLGTPAGQQRYALRDRILPPPDPYDYTSPLAQFRGYVKNRRETELFRVTGAQAGDRLTLATMDSYDREVYEVAGGTDKDSDSGAFLRTATGVDLAGDHTGPTRTATITVGQYDRIWMPTLGRATTRIDPGSGASAGIADSLYVNASSHTLVDRAGLHHGQSYRVTYEPYTPPTPARTKTLRFAAVSLPPLPALDPTVQAKAKEFVGDERSDFGRMQRLTQAIKDQAAYSHGLANETTSLPGHGEARLLSMLAEMGVDEDNPAAAPTGMIGDDEQLAALTAVLARSLGIPARVVMGFKLPEDEDDQRSGSHGVAVTGNDVAAWVEVKFEGVGWVRFDPIPDTIRKPTQPQEQVVDQPKPHVAQPPPPPVEPPRLPPAMVGDSGPRPVRDPEPTPTWVLAGAIAASPLVLVAAVLALILAVKALRRRRRHRRGDSHERIGGAWDELLDYSTDLGLAPPRRATRQEVARLWEDRYTGAELRELAARADRGVFAPETMDERSVEEYWEAAATARARMAATVSRRRRLRARISLRSLRRRSDRPRRPGRKGPRS